MDTKKVELQSKDLFEDLSDDLTAAVNGGLDAGGNYTHFQATLDRDSDIAPPSGSFEDIPKGIFGYGEYYDYYSIMHYPIVTNTVQPRLRFR